MTLTPVVQYDKLLSLNANILYGFNIKVCSDFQELMKMMGMKSWMLWCGWMVNGMIVNIASITIIVILLKAPFKGVSVLQYSDGCLVWVFLIFYCAAGITFCFALSSLFSRRKSVFIFAAIHVKDGNEFFYNLKLF